MKRDPESLVRAAFRAIAEEDWPGLVDLCDSVSVQVLAEQLTWSFRHEQRQWTVDDYLKYVPDMTREVAEYQAELQAKQSRPDVRLSEEFPTVPSIEELLALSSEDVMVAWLTARSTRMQIEGLVARGEASRAAADRALADLSNRAPVVILGVAMDGDRIAHVIHREEAGSFLPPDEVPADPDRAALELDLLNRRFVSLTTCRMGPNGRWGIVADHRMFDIGPSMVYLLEQPEEHAED